MTSVKPSGQAVTKHHNPEAGKTLRFLELPAEVRQMIYNFFLCKPASFEVLEDSLLSKDRRLTHWRYPDDPPDSVDEHYRWIFSSEGDLDVESKVSRYRQSFINKATIRGITLNNGDPLESPSALLRVCKLIHLEVVPLFYSRVRLSFAHRSTLAVFMQRLTPIAISHIRKLNLRFPVVYDSDTARRQPERHRQHQNRWTKAIDSIATRMTGLEAISLFIDIREWPSDYDIGARWADPLLSFAQRPRLMRVAIVFCLEEVFWLCDVKLLELLALDLERTILGARFDERKLADARDRLGNDPEGPFEPYFEWLRSN